VIQRAVDQHVIDDGQDRGGEGADGLFGAASGAQAMKLRLEIAGLLAGGGPGALHQRGLEPGRSLAHPGGPRLAVGLQPTGWSRGLSSFLGRSPAQEIRCPAVGKRRMSRPISARMMRALSTEAGRFESWLAPPPGSSAPARATSEFQVSRRRETWPLFASEPCKVDLDSLGAEVGEAFNGR
jgi:hypothetical protein